MPPRRRALNTPQTPSPATVAPPINTPQTLSPVAAAPPTAPTLPAAPPAAPTHPAAPPTASTPTAAPHVAVTATLQNPRRNRRPATRLQGSTAHRAGPSRAVDDGEFIDLDVVDDVNEEEDGNLLTPVEAVRTVPSPLQTQAGTDSTRSNPLATGRRTKQVASEVHHFFTKDTTSGQRIWPIASNLALNWIQAAAAATSTRPGSLATAKPSNKPEPWQHYIYITPHKPRCILNVHNSMIRTFEL
ncbi:uncharacterized protein F5891DRAFT_978909 [Suillus fuscotomentosus]|uniref:Uncharacterized protein n=1 Tax=Suillus fuscotomentosus TaxID=1912939 RepID=A0AAD4E9H8_9AGAM|nr:uncharacterized protein F5891DRAFT_978909 [Suillus fuscotomentosus]KAG1902200.1 hypothetical protein F5891DRAFT_978909 [Suillus fuscotomentosus]